MLTRLKISGFKNLVDVDISFGPFTCFAGPNGTGKSNVFDAINFLSSTAVKPLIAAAKSIRDPSGKDADARSIFHQIGQEFDSRMTFEVEMIIPKNGKDELGQKATANPTFLRYRLGLEFKKSEDDLSSETIEIFQEDLDHIQIGEARKHLSFPHSTEWRRSAVSGRRNAPFISTHSENGQTKIKLHQEGGQGRAKNFVAEELTKTILSTITASDSPTASLARKEMMSWYIQQLEPSALRKSDGFDAPSELGPDGSHLPAFLFRLYKRNNKANSNSGSTYEQIGTRLYELIEEIKSIRVDRDEERRLFTLKALVQDGTELPARSLSDGTLRFLALSAMELDPDAGGVICLEEPENGIHPKRIPAIIALLQDLAVDPNFPLAEDNPLRQVIVNTHSPGVVSLAPDDSIIYVEQIETVRNGSCFKAASFKVLPDTWRSGMIPPPSVVAKGDLVAYLNPTLVDGLDLSAPSKSKPRRLIDRADYYPFLPFDEK